MRVLLVAPILIPFLTATLSILFWKERLMQRRLSLAGSTILLAVTVVLLYAIKNEGIQAVQIGNWPAPFGITVVADLLSAIMLVLGAIIGVAVNVYAAATVDAQREVFGFYPLLQILLMGISGAFLAGDLFNLYVWFEVMLISSFVLLALGGERPQLEGAFKYVTLNLVSSALFLAAVGLVYGAMGTLNMADLALKVKETGHPAVMSATAMLFLTAFGIKAAVFPLFFWLPASYHTPPAAVSAVFAGLLTKVGVYALLRVFTLIFVFQARMGWIPREELGAEQLPSPIRPVDAELPPIRKAPDVGQHDQEILREVLGYDEQKAKQLVADGIVGPKQPG
jgi:multicomponent Na+:H+ antiporter subunit D